jgi:hypothetical protein
MDCAGVDQVARPAAPFVEGFARLRAADHMVGNIPIPE